MLSPEQIQVCATRLHEAEASGAPVRALSQDYPGMTIEDAYAVQAAWVKIKQAEGQKIIGRKVGLTSKAMQNAMGIDEPDFGTLLDSMWIENNATVAASQFIDPRVEVELAFVLKQPLAGPDLSVEDVIEATDFVVPSLELIAARSHRVDPDNGYVRTVVDTIADNAANGGIVVGDTPVKPSEIDMRWAGAILYRNGVVEETGLGAGILDHPAHGIVWLAKRFAPHGVALGAGEYILSGSFTRPVIANSGDEFCADFGALGKVGLRFS